MRSKNRYLILLILLLVICGGLTTYALFRTNKSGNATVNAARWNVVFKNGESKIENNFNIQLSNATWTNPLGNVASGKIAPGSSATFYITIDATGTETSVDYTAEIDESFDESDFEVTLAEDSGTIPYSTVEDAMIRQIPIQVIWNGNVDDNNDKNENDLLKKARDITIPLKVTAAQKLILPYTITFNSMGGSAVQSMKVRENHSIGTLPTSLKDGYILIGWFDENDVQITEETIPTESTTYYGHWWDLNQKVNLVTDYRKSYEGNGYSGGNTPINAVDGSMATGNGKNWYGGTKLLVEFNSLSSIEKIGVYTTENWGYSMSSATIYYSQDDSLTLTSDLSGFEHVTVSTEADRTLSETITAKRVLLVKGDTNAVYEFKCIGSPIFLEHSTTRYVTISFNSNGGSAVESQRVVEGSSLSSIPTSTRSESTFLGWFDSNDNQLTTSTIINDDITYTARWDRSYNIGSLVYYDPVSTNLCNLSTYTGSNTCYKWRVIGYDSSNDQYNILLDHQLINEVTWNNTGNTSDGPVNVLTQLASSTSSWTRVSGLNYTYDTSASSQNYGTLSCNNGTCTISSTGAKINNVKARLITGEEVAAITGINWSLSNNTRDFNYSGNSWLYENSTSKWGYFTLSPSSSTSASCYYMYNGTALYYTSVNSSGVGARPVITVPKSNLN